MKNLSRKWPGPAIATVALLSTGCTLNFSALMTGQISDGGFEGEPDSAMGASSPRASKDAGTDAARDSAVDASNDALANPPSPEGKLSNNPNNDPPLDVPIAGDWSGAPAASDTLDVTTSTDWVGHRNATLTIKSTTDLPVDTTFVFPTSFGDTSGVSLERTNARQVLLKGVNLPSSPGSYRIGLRDGVGSVGTGVVSIFRTRIFPSFEDGTFPAQASEAFPWVIDGPVNSIVSLKAAAVAETTRALPSRWTGISGGTLLEWRDATLRGSPYQRGMVPVDMTVQQSGWGYHFEQFGLGTIGKAWVTKRSDELAPQLYWSVKQYSTYCPGCTLQVIVGIDDTPRACLVTTMPGPWPGRQTPASGVNVTPLLTGWGLDLPGRHRIQSRMADATTCEDAMKCSGSSCGWRTEGIVDVSPPVASSCAATLESLNYPIRMSVDIVSGTMNGQHFVGAIDYDASLVSKTDRSVIAARNVRFCYRNGLLESFDAPPQLEFDKGTFVRAIGTGGDQQNRFGFNAGFDRGQFGRETEAFIRNGDDYFAYLNPATYVDGAGVINYSVVPPTSSCFWMENTSGTFAWVPASWASTRDACRAQDSCSAGGGNQSGGGCYKWATSASAPGEPW